MGAEEFKDFNIRNLEYHMRIKSEKYVKDNHDK